MGLVKELAGKRFEDRKERYGIRFDFGDPVFPECDRELTDGLMNSTTDFNARCQLIKFSAHPSQDALIQALRNAVKHYRMTNSVLTAAVCALAPTDDIARKVRYG